MLIPIDAIAVGANHRRIVPGKVKELAMSIETLGLRVPIAVRPGKRPATFVLVVGRHRLEAHRRLGRPQIEVEVFDDVLEAKLWEIAENLHRAELSALQRNLLTGAWVKLRAEKIKRVSATVAKTRHRGRGGRPIETGITAAARELGIPETTARRAASISTRLTKKAQKAAEKLGLENRTALLERAAKSDDPDYQVQVLQQHADRAGKREQEKAQIASVIAGTNTPKTPKEAFDRWFWSLDIVMRLELRIWLLSRDAEAYLEDLEKTEELLRQDRGAMH